MEQLFTWSHFLMLLQCLSQRAQCQFLPLKPLTSSSMREKENRGLRHVFCALL